MASSDYAIVMVRSTPGITEPRYNERLKQLSRLPVKTGQITWLRTELEIQNLRNPNARSFTKLAPYGQGFKNLYSLFLFQIFIYRKLTLLNPKVIYSCDLDTLITCLIWGKFRKRVIIYDQYDPYSSRVTSARFERIVNWVENLFASMCHLRITANLHRITSASRSAWIEVPNYFEIMLPKDPSINSTNKIFYGGVIQRDRGLVSIIRAMEDLPQWKLEIYGDGPIFSELLAMTREIANANLKRKVPHAELINLASSARLYAALYDPNKGHNQFTASNKLFEATQMEIPLLSARGTALAEDVEKYGLGWVVDYGDIDQIKAAVAARESWTETDYFQFRSRCRQFLETHDTKSRSEILNEKILSLLGGIKA